MKMRITAPIVATIIEPKTSSGDAGATEQLSACYRADDADGHVPDEAPTSAFPQIAGKPACCQADQKKPEESVHGIPSLGDFLRLRLLIPYYLMNDTKKLTLRRHWHVIYVK
jgi:hypothetical protein